MTTVDTNAAYRDQIREAKRLLRANMPDLKERFALLTRRLEASVAEVQAIRARGDSPVPTVNAAELDSVSDETKALIRQRGCVVIKGVFNSVQIDQWNASIATYLTDLDYLGKADSKRGIINISAPCLVQSRKFTACTGRLLKCKLGSHKRWPGPDNG